LLTSFSLFKKERRKQEGGEENDRNGEVKEMVYKNKKQSKTRKK